MIGRIERAAFHLIGGVGRGDLIHADGHLAVADLDAAIRLAHPIHQHQHLLLAGQGHIAVGVNIIDRGRLRQACQEGCFSQRQLIGCLAEIGFGGGFDAIGKIAVINLVEIQLEDLILGIAARDFRRQDDLARFA